ncbi:uncharacterized protein LOC126281977 isoform X2 [Schistocerca gregaria]|uniref:uncharacterized protein LOC126281977 isoform X2 n=1 Tax=Schistocerca gregaria TaxID=7010 RepID=UPI00211E32E1|nr:uncharacterized protein LOC126281977 isoform X2 [Schistocerca gregaria]
MKSAPTTYEEETSADTLCDEKITSVPTCEVSQSPVASSVTAREKEVTVAVPAEVSPATVTTSPVAEVSPATVTTSPVTVVEKAEPAEVSPAAVTTSPSTAVEKEATVEVQCSLRRSQRKNTSVPLSDNFYGFKPKRRQKCEKTACKLTDK